MQFTKRGWPVIPLHGIKDGICTCHEGRDCVSPGKHPRIKDWINSATLNKEKINEWFEKWPDANLGVITGNRPGIVVLDVDPRNDGDLSIEEIKKAVGEIPETVESITGGGGRHIYFKYPGGNIGSKTGIKKGLDVKADGGFIVVPPSMHVSSKRYMWRPSCGPYEIELASMPDWLLLIIKKIQQEKKNIKQTGELVPEGQRNSRLASLAGTLRRKGFNEQELNLILYEFNNNHCDPPLPDDEVVKISRSISRYEPENTEIDLTKINCTDSGNAEIFTELFGKEFKFNNNRKKWMFWNGNNWQIDEDGEARRKMLVATKTRYRLAGDLTGHKDKAAQANWALRSESDYLIKSALNCASSNKIFSSKTSDFDYDPFLLGCPNGTLNLKTGEMRPGQQEDMITMSTGIKFDPNAKAPRWIRFLNEIFMENPDLIEFVHRFIGYSLTGSTQEQVFSMCYGTGSNGKSVFLNIVRGLMGSYATNTSFSTFETSRIPGNKIPNDIAALVGKRLVTVSEVQEGCKWNEGLVKSVTGEDPISARFLHQEYFTYTPQFKLWLAVNHKPISTDTSDAFWRRLHLIPFLNNFKGQKRDNDLPRKLKAEYSGILAWAVNGCQKWLEKGLDPPDTVTAATEEYRREEDIIQSYLDERTDRNDDAKISAQRLYEDYKEWCEKNGAKPWSGARFGRRLGEKGFERGKLGSLRTTHYFGITIKELKQ